MKPQVFAGLYPIEANQYDALRDSLEKLKLNDSSLQYEPEVSQALGFGFRCGFLGLLHMEIVQERLEREFDMDLITTAPTVVYEVVQRDGTMHAWSRIRRRCRTVGRSKKSASRSSPCNLYMPQDYVGSVITLCTQKRGVQINMQYHGRQVQLTYEIPMARNRARFLRQAEDRSRAAMRRWTTSSRNTARRTSSRSTC